ncbi:di-heme oxidoredictase family protein [Martelella limonii]|uniref:di-heme oxidoreductase family protein n=1 Tax=Martelella limonii TaxID=1647649 RepID=UPI00157FF3C7
MTTAALAACLCFTAVHAGDWMPPDQRSDITAEDKARVEKVTRPTQDFSKAEAFEIMQGGAATSTASVNRDSYSHSSANITFAEEETFKLGNALFRKFWVSSPSSTQASDGLGPLFNARSCQSCHLKDGRGHPPAAGEDASSMFLRLARPARTPEEQARIDNYETINFPDKVYGGQLQDFAVPGLSAEGQMKIDYTEREVTLGDGTTVSLRHPTYSVENLAYGDLGEDTTLSPRVANQMIGLGLVQAIEPADILGLADPDDADGDGISGRPNIVSDTVTGEVKLGRFGWKAQNATIHDQSVGAMSGDIGVSSPNAPNPYGDCSEAQAECLAMPNGVQPRLGDTEAPDPVMELVTFYAENLAVPARRDVDDPDVLRGKQVFYEAGCTACHTPKFVTSRDAENPAHQFQLIWPYSDFLLHDMGEGLADGQQVAMASGSEWRTAPLWGTGLTEVVNGHSFFLHDGRARNRTEAILWHGGEAQQARDNFANAPKDDREALIKFLESL